MKLNFYTAVLAVAVCILITLIAWKSVVSDSTKPSITETKQLKKSSSSSPTTSMLKPSELLAMLKFIPKRNFTDCVELFDSTTEASEFQMSPQFTAGIDEFLAALAKITAGRGPDEGHSYRYNKIYSTLHYLAQLDFVQTVCETGFNGGHSSFNFLTAKPNIVLHTFDIGSHYYVPKMGNYLKQKFGDRFFQYIGDSTKTLRAFVANNSVPGGVKCDLIHVDGGHSYEVALKDSENFGRLANLAHNVVFSDNINYEGASKAWKEMLTLGTIKELMTCMNHKPGKDLIGVGTYVRRPSLFFKNDY